MYTPLGIRAVKSPHPTIYFPSGANIRFASLQREADVHNFQGAQICLLCCEINTPVLMADGTYKKISDIKIGDKVNSLGGVATVTHKGEPQYRECVKAELPNGNFQIQTTDHKILTKQGWLCYEDLVSQPNLNHNNQESSSYTHSLYESLEKALSLTSLGQEHIRKFLLRHWGYHQLTLEQFACQIACEPHPSYSSLPIEYYDGHICDDKWLWKYQTFLPYLVSHNGHHQHTSEKQVEILHHLILSEIYGYNLSEGQENDCELFDDARVTSCNSILDHLLQDVSLHSHKSHLDFDISHVLVTDVMPYAPCETSIQDCWENCLTYSRHNDGQPLLLSKNDQFGVQLLNDVVVHTPICYSWDDEDKTPKDTYHVLQYKHPYTHKQCCEKFAHQYQPLKLTPFGKHIVQNITISSTNNYITEHGIVNKNCFDEVNHFSENSFFYMLSRNRSVCGVKPYVRATCNPDIGWLADFLQWYWDPDTGYAIPERSGVVRYFARFDNVTYWGDTPEDLIAKYPQFTKDDIKSFTFVASKLSDNKILMEANPGYLASLKSQSLVERERLLNGNWKIRPSSGAYFKKEHFEIVEAIPHGVVNWVRSWDLACTEPSGKNPSPDATAGILMGKLQDGRYIIADCRHSCVNADKVRQTIFSTATLDKSRHKFVHITVPQDAGQAGKDQAQSLIRMLSGYSVSAIRPSGSKVVRATPFSAQVQAGNVVLLKGEWNEGLLDELEAFPEGQHDDRVDACSDAFNTLQTVKSWAGLVS